jgi:hypothetical protein
MNIIEYRSTYIPVYYIRGAQLPIFELEAEQTGTFAALLLRREEDCALLPIAVEQVRIDGQCWREELDVTHSLRQLERDGWELYGQIVITKEAIPDMPCFQNMANLRER